MCGCAYLTGKFPFPDILRSEQKVALYTANNASVTTSFSLFTSDFSFLLNCFTIGRRIRVSAAKASVVAGLN
jgi:hypothetical protein